MEFDHDLLSELIAESKEDEVGLWLIIATLRNNFGIDDPATLRSITLDYVRSLLESGEVIACNRKADRDGVVSWNMPTCEIISRIDREWEELGREPNIGDIVVFLGRQTKPP